MAGKAGECAGETNGGGDEKKKNGEKGKIVLGVWIHCPGCEDAVRKSLRGYSGVESVEVDSVKNRVTVKGEKADPVKVAKRVGKKTGKPVDLISPIPPKEKKKEEKIEEKKQKPKIVDVNVKVYLHCEGCAKDVQRCIYRMPGVHTVETDMDKNVVKVKGAIEADKLIGYVMKRTGKHAEIAKPDKKPKDQKQKDGEEGNENQKKKENGNSNYDKFWSDAMSRELVYAPQLFSDENPNACSVM